MQFTYVLCFAKDAPLLRSGYFPYCLCGTPRFAYAYLYYNLTTLLVSLKIYSVCVVNNRILHSNKYVMNKVFALGIAQPTIL